MVPVGRPRWLQLLKQQAARPRGGVVGGGATPPPLSRGGTASLSVSSCGAGVSLTTPSERYDEALPSSSEGW